MKLPKRLKTRWLKALRSGEYGQAKETLCDGYGNFCCLGVLEHIVLGGEIEINQATGKYLSMPSGQFYKYANIEVRLINPNTDMVFDPDVCLLTDANDEGENFKFIANWIERNIQTK